MSSLNAALPQIDGAPMPAPPSLRSPAVIESPTNSRRRAEGGGGGASWRGEEKGNSPQNPHSPLPSRQPHSSIGDEAIDGKAGPRCTAREA